MEGTETPWMFMSIVVGGYADWSRPVLPRKTAQYLLLGCIVQAVIQITTLGIAEVIRK